MTGKSNRLLSLGRTELKKLALRMETPDRRDSFFDRAIVAWAKGDSQNAERWSELAISTGPPVPAYYMVRSKIRLAQGLFVAASSDLATAFEILAPERNAVRLSQKTKQVDAGVRRALENLHEADVTHAGGSKKWHKVSTKEFGQYWRWMCTVLGTVISEPTVEIGALLPQLQKWSVDPEREFLSAFCFGRCLVRLGKNSEAVAEFDHAIRLYKANFVSHWWRAYSMFDFPAAAATATTDLSTRILAHGTISIPTRKEAAFRELNRTIALAPFWGQARALRSLCSVIFSSDFNGALADIDFAAKLEPDNPELRRLKNLILSQRQYFDKGVLLFKQMDAFVGIGQTALRNRTTYANIYTNLTGMPLDVFPERTGKDVITTIEWTGTIDELAALACKQVGPGKYRDKKTAAREIAKRYTWKNGKKISWETLYDRMKGMKVE